MPESILSADEGYMRRCFTLARLGRPLVNTNPLVGCCIVYQDRIIGEGYHHHYGADHAEINAIKSIKKSDLAYLTQATLYVSLSPCNHVGKTAACSATIIELGIPRVVIGMQEINPVAKGGISALRDAGVEVTAGILSQDARALVRSFESGVTQKRPYVTLKWAQTADGFIGTKGLEVKISSLQTQLKAHDLRRQHNAILVGAGTVIVDNPELTTRVIPGPSPLRVVILGEREIPSSAAILTDEHATIIFSIKKLPYDWLNEKKRWVLLEKIDLEAILSILYEDYQVGWLLIEGGANILNQFIQQNLWDECWRITSPSTLNRGILAPVITGTLSNALAFGSDQLDIFIPKH